MNELLEEKNVFLQDLNCIKKRQYFQNKCIESLTSERTYEISCRKTPFKFINLCTNIIIFIVTE